jgi:hypothetical protein
MNNPNHPKNGSSTLVQPIRELSHIQSIKKLLASRPRDLLLFTLGINNGIRTGDLLKLKISHVKYAKPGQAIQIRESKTGKKKWVHFFGPVNGKTKVDSFIGYAAHLGLIRGGTPSGLYC